MTSKERNILKRLISEMRRQIVETPADGIIHDESGYLRGCRCDSCRKAHTDATRLRRQRRREQMILAGTYRPHNRDKTRCANGHPYTPENTYLYQNGWRQCRICRKTAARGKVA